MFHPTSPCFSNISTQYVLARGCAIASALHAGGVRTSQKLFVLQTEHRMKTFVFFQPEEISCLPTT